MKVVGFVLGFADFLSPLTIQEVASTLSREVFGGIPFVEKNVDEDYEVGTLCLKDAFIGLQVELFGGDGGYTLELGTKPSASVQDRDTVFDFSELIKQQVAKCGFDVVDGF